MNFEKLKKYESTNGVWFIKQLIIKGGEDFTGLYAVAGASVIVAKTHLLKDDVFEEGDYIHMSIRGVTRRDTQRAKEIVLALISERPYKEYGKRMIELWFKEEKK